jgi:hypothetical protein
MKVIIFAITPRDFGIPLFATHDIDIANAIMSNLRLKTPAWDFFAYAPTPDKHAMGRNFLHEQTNKTKKIERLKARTLPSAASHSADRKRRLSLRVCAEQAQPESTSRVEGASADQPNGRGAHEGQTNGNI